jgi:hypothetical protein
MAVIGFGSRYEKLFPTSRAYDDSSLEIANRHASGISADLGGTELLAPLRDVLSSPADPQFPRQVFVLVRTRTLICVAHGRLLTTLCGGACVSCAVCRVCRAADGR